MATLLVVDDDHNIRSRLARYLSGAAHRALLAADGIEALRLADAEPVDVVLTDVHMAGMDGMALLAELKRRRPDAVVIVMTAYATIAGAVEAMRRAEDLPALVDHLLAGLCVRHRLARPALEPRAREALAAYAWPGNVRELANALERALVLSPGDGISAESLPDAVLAPPATAAPEAGAPPESLSLEEVERLHVQRVLAGSATLEEAAARLGIDPTTLWRKRKRWGLD